jgi:hypothetical protein
VHSTSTHSELTKNRTETNTNTEHPQGTCVLY